MEGFVNFGMRPWLRRIIARMMAIIPAAITVYLFGQQGTFTLLILSQVILSMQLPFAVIPLIQFTSNRRRMGAFANKVWVQALAWIMAVIIVVLNAQVYWEWIVNSRGNRWLLWLGGAPLGILLLALVAWVTLEPMLSGWLHRTGPAPPSLPHSVRAG